MKRFVQLFVELDTTNKTAEKVDAMERYFREARPEDAAWALFFLSGLRLKRIAKTSMVREAARQATGMPDWMLDECYEATGDFSETIALLLRPRQDGGAFDETLRDVVEQRIMPLVHAEDAQATRMLLDAWRTMERNERFVFNKLIRGNFRVGVQRALVVRALAQALGVDSALLTHRLTGTFAPTPENFEALRAPAGAAMDTPQPYPFCLAAQLDAAPEDLGPVGDWQVEYKWDGIRAQIVRRGDVKRSPSIWSRGEELITDQFPEIAAAAQHLPVGTVLDGEILAWRFGLGADDGHPLSFNALQTRLNRKNVQPSLFSKEGIVYLAFDVLEFEGRDLRDTELHQRRKILEVIAQRVSVATGGLIRLPSAISPQDWDEVGRVREAARQAQGAEGLMLKHQRSRYHTGRIAGGTAASIAAHGGMDAGWWKWKVAPYSVDAVLIYAQQGSGRRAGLYTDYTFGVWEPDASGTLTPFAKAYSGLSNEEIQRVDAFIRANTIGRNGPIRMIKPELVFEISFEGIQKSTRHRSGIAVRFPRITRWRTDKSVSEADTLSSVQAILDSANRRDA